MSKQKFKMGTKVYVNPGSDWWHLIKKGEKARVRYTHGQEHGSNDFKSYALYFKSIGNCAWFDEKQLTKVTKK